MKNSETDQSNEMKIDESDNNKMSQINDTTVERIEIDDNKMEKSESDDIVVEISANIKDKETDSDLKMEGANEIKLEEENVGSPTFDHLTPKKSQEKLKSFTNRMTNKELELYLELVKAKRNLSKYYDLIKSQMAETGNSDMMSKSHFCKIIEKLPSPKKLISLIKLRDNKKKTNWRKFTDEEKEFAIALYKNDPSAYRFFEKILVLPDLHTLIKFCIKASVEWTIDLDHSIAQLKSSASSLSRRLKICVLLFSEKPLKGRKGMQNIITGFEMVGNEKRPIFADHSQMFMISGITIKYQDPISYTFSSGPTQGSDLAVQIKTIITKLQKIHYQVLAIICSNNENNKEAIKILTEETKSNHDAYGKSCHDNIFVVNGKEIITLYDPPQLMISMRNCFMSNNVLFDLKDKKNMTVKWEHLEMMQPDKLKDYEAILVAKLTKSHIFPTGRQLTKLKYASQVFSQRVAAGMALFARGNTLPEECQDTAQFLVFFDLLFDSVNCSRSALRERAHKTLMYPVTGHSQHHRKWKEAIELFRSMRFINSNGDEVNVPTKDDWIWTINGVQLLVQKLLKTCGMTSVWMREFNLDPIEKLLKANLAQLKSRRVKLGHPLCNLTKLHCIDTIYKILVALNNRF